MIIKFCQFYFVLFLCVDVIIDIILISISRGFFEKVFFFSRLSQFRVFRLFFLIPSKLYMFEKKCNWQLFMYRSRLYVLWFCVYQLKVEECWKNILHNLVFLLPTASALVELIFKVFLIFSHVVSNRLFFFQ